MTYTRRQAGATPFKNLDLLLLTLGPRHMPGHLPGMLIMHLQLVFIGSLHLQAACCVLSD